VWRGVMWSSPPLPRVATPSQRAARAGLGHPLSAECPHESAVAIGSLRVCRLPRVARSTYRATLKTGLQPSLALGGGTTYPPSLPMPSHCPLRESGSRFWTVRCPPRAGSPAATPGASGMVESINCRADDTRHESATAMGSFSSARTSRLPSHQRPTPHDWVI
jgi:hypothetical protein